MFSKQFLRRAYQGKTATGSKCSLWPATIRRLKIDSLQKGDEPTHNLQGVVYNLDFADGSPTGWVLKADAGSFTAKAMPPMLLEWVLGRSLLKALGQKKQGAVSNYESISNPIVKLICC